MKLYLVKFLTLGVTSFLPMVVNAFVFKMPIYQEDLLQYAEDLPFYIHTPQSEEELCSAAKTPHVFKVRALSPESRMSFKNAGGLFNQGVCWWHSRLQRAAIYLAAFDPQKPMPHPEELRKILKTLKTRSDFVEIGGFANFFDFSSHYQNEIQDLLNQWQLEDGIIKQKWVKGIWGRSQVSPQNIWKKIIRLYHEVEVENKIAYQKLQMPGVVAHSWLVVNVEKQSTGFDIYAIDSNRPSQTLYYPYRYGDRYLNIGGYRSVPYSEEKDEYRDYNRVFKKRCGLRIF